MNGMECIEMATEKLNNAVEKASMLETEIMLQFDTMAQLNHEKEKLYLDKMSEMQKQHTEEKESMRKHYQRIILSISLVLLLVIGSLVGGAVYLISNFDFEFEPSYSQDVSAEGGGDSTIEDGIHINDWRDPKE